MLIQMIIAALIAILAVLGWFFSEKNKFAALKITHLLIALAVVELFVSTFLMEYCLMASLLFMAIPVLNFGLSYIKAIKKDWMTHLIVLVIGHIVFLLPEHHLSINGFEVDVLSIQFFIPFTIGLVSIFVSNFLEKSWGKFFKLDFKTQRGISRALFFFVFAIGFLISDFMAAELGWLAFMLGFVSIMMHGKRSGALWNLFLAVSAFASVGAFMEIGNVSSVELSSGKVLAGVVLAGGIALLMNTLSRARKNKLWSNVISLGLAFLAPIILIIGGTQNVQFGGTDAFVGLLIGFALTTMFGINIKKNISVFGIYMVLGLVLIPLTSVDEAQTTLSTMTKVKGESSTEKMSSPMGLAGKAVDQNGSFNIIKENSKIVFELGPKNGRTKGAINALVGSFNIENNSPSMKVELDIASLTTFNDIRDESLMSDMYFNSVKFPKMTFTSKSAILSGDVYELQGEFEMLGMKKNQIVKMKYLGSKDGQMNFVGEGSIDRTEFGMTPDSKEGNIVDFMFEVSVK